jgi:hypothetical protein
VASMHNDPVLRYSPQIPRHAAGNALGHAVQPQRWPPLPTCQFSAAATVLKPYSRQDVAAPYGPPRQTSPAQLYSIRDNDLSAEDQDCMACCLLRSFGPYSMVAHEHTAFSFSELRKTPGAQLSLDDIKKWVQRKQLETSLTPFCCYESAISLLSGKKRKGYTPHNVVCWKRRNNYKK